MFQWVCDFHLGCEAFRLFVWTLTALLLLLLLAPVVFFFRYGWPSRKADILDSFSETAVIYYLERFHPSAARDVIERVNATDEAADAGWRQMKSDAAAKEVEAAVKENAGDQTGADTLRAEATRLRQAAKQAKSQAKLTEQQKKARKVAMTFFADYFNDQFGRSRFALPLALLLLLAGCLLSACSSSVVYWREHNKMSDDVIPVVVVMAIFGGFTWVVYDLIDRLRSYDITPRTLLWSSFRLMIAAPVGFAFGRVFNETLAVPMAYLLGTLPTETIMTVARRATAKWAQLTDAPVAAQSVLQVLNSVDTYTAERLANEGVTTVLQLAYADPVRLSIRTGLSFSVVLGCASEALLGIYLSEKKQLDAARKYGLEGAYECGMLWEELREGDPAQQARAKAILTSLASELQTTYEGLEHIIEQVADDPYTEFQIEVWGDTL